MVTHHPYIVSNRDFTKPLKPKDSTEYPTMKKDGSLTCFIPQTTDPNKPPFSETSSGALYCDWLTSVLADVKAETVKAETVKPPRVMIFIHGYANSWSKVIDPTDGLARMVSNFWSLATPSYPGPIILFDWPSDDVFGMLKPKQAYLNAQEVARNTAALSFDNKKIPIDLKTIIADIYKNKSGPQVAIDVVCHSMGNYVLQQGAHLLDSGGISRCLINAAAIADDSFNPTANSPTEASGINACLDPSSGAAFVYFNTHDEVLKAAPDLWQPELGRSGVQSATNVYSCYKGEVDCSFIKSPIPSCGVSIHTSYYCSPDVLNSMIFLMTTEVPTAPSAIPGTKLILKRKHISD